MSDVINLEADAAGVQVEDSAINRVATLAEAQLELENRIAQLEDLQKELAEKHKKISEYDLPDAMSQAGISEFKLVNGAKITIKPFYSGKITDENRESAFSWLRENEFEDLIKHELTVPLGRGNDELAKEITKFLTSIKANFLDKESVHHSTLNAFIKEQVEAGQDFPMSTFNAYIGRRAKIKI